MLLRLLIRDFVIVERLELEFTPAFSVLTGETGAGKSILIDALKLALGERAEPSVVRSGAERADISAEFDVTGLPLFEGWLLQHELAGDEGLCLLRRVVDAGGRSRGFINGHAATAAQLREAGEFLVDIHGQHQHQSLSRPSAQRDLLDAYGGLQDLAAATAACWREWHRRQQERAEFEGNAAAVAAERERLGWQAQDLDTLNPVAGEWEAVAAEHARLSNAAGLIEAAQQGANLLVDADDALVDRVGQVIARIEAQCAHDPALREVLELLQPAQMQLQEAAGTLRRYAERSDLDPARLQEVERRLDALHAAGRRYRVAPDGLAALREETVARLRELEAGGDPAVLRQREADAEAAYRAEAKKLSAGRRKTAVTLADTVTAAMQELAMTGGRFAVELSPAPTPQQSGLEQVEFQVAPHPGVALQPVAKTASGGELSRLSLAIQTALSQVARVPTLIFDEVDVGIGGRVAEIVGRLLKALGAKHQVMCITHLPQVAAAADRQWQVSKSGAGGKPATTVRLLDSEGRVEEIARMLGGLQITATTRQHAAEMLAGVPAAPAVPAGKKPRGTGRQAEKTVVTSSGARPRRRGST